MNDTAFSLFGLPHGDDILCWKCFGLFEYPYLNRDLTVNYGVLLVLVLVAIALWNLVLRRQVQARTAHLEAEIAERKASQEALRQSEEKHRLLFDNAGDAIFIADTATRMLGVNPQACTLLGYTCGELMSMTIDQVDAPAESRSVPERLAGLMEQGQLTFETTHRRKDGSLVPMEVNARLITWDGKTAIMSICRDITERRRFETELQETMQRLHLATVSGGFGIWDWDISGNRMIWNDRMFELYGVTREDFPQCMTAWRNGLHPDDRNTVIAACEAARRGERAFNTEFRVLHPDGAVKCLKADALVLRDASGTAVRMIGLNWDITEVRQAEETVRLSLLEKETLLRELYHRTKNNMQVISSLLNLQAASLGDPALRQLFADARSRIQAMSLVHEKLYQSHDLSKLDLGLYIGELAESIMKSYKTAEGQITLTLDLEACAASIDFATPLGLIINELMSNSLKYAFPDGRPGSVCINLFRDGVGGITVLYQDNGAGLPEPAELCRAKTLGLQLVCGLVETQLKGLLVVTGGQGKGLEFMMHFSGVSPVCEQA